MSNRLTDSDVIEVLRVANAATVLTAWIPCAGGSHPDAKQQEDHFAPRWLLPLRDHLAGPHARELDIPVMRFLGSRHDAVSERGRDDHTSLNALSLGVDMVLPQARFGHLPVSVFATCFTKGTDALIRVADYSGARNLVVRRVDATTGTGRTDHRSPRDHSAARKHRQADPRESFHSRTLPQPGGRR